MRNRIKEFRKAKKLTQQQLADILGIHLTNLNRMENGRSAPDLTRLQQVADALDTTPNELIVPEDEGSRFKVKVGGYIGAGARIYPVSDFGIGEALEEVELDLPLPAGTVAAIVRGDSMMPVFEDGDLIGYFRDSTDPMTVLNRTCIVQVTDGPIYIKTLKRGSERGLFTLSSFNATDIEDVAIDWAAPFQFRVSRDQWRKL